MCAGLSLRSRDSHAAHPNPPGGKGLVMGGIDGGLSSVEVAIVGYNSASSSSIYSAMTSHSSMSIPSPKPVRSFPQSSFPASTSLGFFFGLMPAAFILLSRSFCLMRASVGNERIV